MRPGWRAGLTGLGIGLAVALPATVVAQILDAVGDDDDLPLVATVGLSLIILAAPLVGAFVAGRRRRSRWGVRGALVGGACLLVIAVFGTIRQAAAGEDTTPFAIPALVIAGGLLGWIGDRAAGAGRTRP